MVKEDIEAAIKEALRKVGVGDAAFIVERPANMEYGDYSTNAAMSGYATWQDIYKKEHNLEKRKQAFVTKINFGHNWSNPRELAESLKKELDGNIVGIREIKIVGTFINFFLTREAIVQEVEAAATKKEWGSNDLYAGKKVMIEYTDPNPFKEFHIGHLMSNAIGESVARLFEAAGANVTRANYQGDVGPHVAKGMFGLLQMGIEDPTVQDLGKAYVEGAKRYEESADDKAAIDELNKKIYEHDDEKINALYQKGREVSLTHFEEIYKILGTTFNQYFFESQSWEQGLALVRAHLSGVFEESEGAVIYRGEQDGLHTRVFINKAGLPTYEAKDLGLLELKKEAGQWDVSITVTASEQQEYFKVVLAAAKHIAEVQDIAQKTQHVTHGMMRFAEGKMSSRTGNVITGESLLRDMADEAKEKMKDRKVADAEKIAEQVAVGAIKYTVLKQGSGKDIIFDPAKSLSLEGDSGPYLQYAHTRALSLIKAAHAAGVEVSQTNLTLSGVVPDTSSVLERTLLHFPETLAHAAQDLEPHYVTTYLTELAAAFNSWYASERVIGSEHEHYGILLAQAVEKTLAKGLQVLGIPAPAEM